MKLFTTFLLIIVLLCCAASEHLFAQNAELWIERTNGSNNAIIGDILSFRVVVNTHGLDITGVNFYLTVDSDCLEPVFLNGQPFQPTSFLKSLYASTNDTGGDSLHLDDSANGIPGFQLNYLQTTGIAVGGEQVAARGVGAIATFQLRVVGLTDGAAVPSVISIDINSGQNRETGYFEAGKIGTRQRFKPVPRNYEMFLAGVKIDPAIPDTIITPGIPYSYDVSSHLLGDPARGAYLWSLQTLQPLTGVESRFNGTVLEVTSDSSSSGLLELRVTAGQQGTVYSDMQDVTIAFNHRPEFAANLPDVVFDEDSYVTMAKSLFFSDVDNANAEISFSAVSANIFIANATDSITFSAAPDWYGSGNVTLEIRDPIQQSVGDSVTAQISVTVNGINDPPVLDLSSFESLELLHNQPKSIVLQNGIHVIDPDNTGFTWEVSGNDTSVFKAGFTNHTLNLEATNMDYSGPGKVVVSVSDNEYTSVDSFMLEIRPTPVVLRRPPAIRIFSGQNVNVKLDEYVDYPRSALDQLTWTFQVRDALTGETDTNVFTEYFDFAYMLSISALATHSAQDRLFIKVEAGSGNADSTTTDLRVYDFNKLTVYDLPDVMLMQNTERLVFDLDQYVVDPEFEPADITWSYTGGTALAGVDINAFAHTVTLSADDQFLGVETIRFIASNPDGGKDSSSISVTCVPQDPRPMFILPLPDKELNWNSVDPVYYGDLDDYIWDYETPDSLLSWRINFDKTFLDVALFSGNRVGMYAYSTAGTREVIFTVTDTDGNSRSDTINVTIIKPGAPTWSFIPTIEFKNSDIFSDLYLRDFCTSKEGEPIQFEAAYDKNQIDVEINNATSQVTITPVNGYDGACDLHFTASISGVTSQSNLIRVSVKDNSTLSYFFNPVVPQWIDFVISSDPAAVSLTGVFSSGTTADTLAFAKIDSNSYQKVWKTTYRSAKQSLFTVMCHLTFSNGLSTSDSLAVSLHTVVSRLQPIRTPDRKIQIDASAGDEISRVFLLTEKRTEMNSISDLFSQEKVTVYTIQPEKQKADNLIQVHAEQHGDGYYGFFRFENGGLIPVETSTDDRGTYTATLPEQGSFVFGPSPDPPVSSRLQPDEVYCYPNPFNHQVRIEFARPVKTKGELVIYNVLGEIVYKKDLGQLDPGKHQVQWQGVTTNHNPVPSGMYIVTIRFSHGSSIYKKIALVK